MRSGLATEPTPATAVDSTTTAAKWQIHRCRREGAGVLNERFAKGAVWGDYDDDGRLDLFVSNQGEQNGRLYHNEGKGTFRDVAEEVGIVGNSSGLGSPPV